MLKSIEVGGYKEISSTSSEKLILPPDLIQNVLCSVPAITKALAEKQPLMMGELESHYPR